MTGILFWVNAVQSRIEWTSGSGTRLGSHLHVGYCADILSSLPMVLYTP